MSNLTSLHERRKQRNRASLRKKSTGKLRLSVHRSGKHIYGQIIDDNQGVTQTLLLATWSNVNTYHCIFLVGHVGFLLL